MALDERSGGHSEIDFRDMMDEDQKLLAPVAWTSGVVVGGTERGDDRASECF